MRRSRAYVAILAIGGLLLAACGGADTDAGGDGDEPISITIGWSPPDITGVFKTATNFFNQSAKQANKHGFDVTVETRSPETHTAYADQVGIVEDFVSQNVDVIAISPAEPEALEPAIQQANDAGIPVIMVNLLREQQGIDIASYIGFDNAEAAQVTAYSILDYFGGPGVLGTGAEVDVDEGTKLTLEWWKQVYDQRDVQVDQTGGVFIEGIAGTFFTRERTKGFNNVLRPYEDISVLAEPIAADWDREKGIRAMESYLSRFQPAPQGRLDFVWGESSEMAIGAATTLERRNTLDGSGGSTPPADGKVAVFSNDVTPETVSMIKNGKIVAETHHGFAEWGWFGTEFGVKVSCGIDVPQFKNIEPRTAWEGNANQFYPDPQLPDINWEQIRSNCES